MSIEDLRDFKQDLIGNDSFIRWVNSEFEEENEYWSNFIDEHPEREEEINHAIKIIRSLQFENRLSIDSDKLWGRIEKSTNIDSSGTGTKRNLSLLKYLPAILAAACLLFLFVYRNGLSDIKEVRTGLAQELVEKFPDGSTIKMDSDTKISYNLNNWKKERKVSLTGLAFFDVMKGAKFTVETPTGLVSVLGTSFSVDSRDGLFEVICKTGRVAVSKGNSEGEEVILNPGDKVSLSEGRLKLKQAVNGQPNEITWVNGIYTFDSEPLTSVIAVLERQYNIKISGVNEYNSLRYTGFFRKGNLPDALYSITWPLGLKYKIDGENVMIMR